MGHICSKNTKTVNSEIKGRGAELNEKEGRTVVMIVGFDYDPANYSVSPEDSGLCQLTALCDAKHFAKLAKASGAEVIKYYDNPRMPSNGFPNKATVVGKMKQIAGELGEDDAFVFFFAGHGMASGGEIDGDETGATELCICDQNGQYNGLKDWEIAEMLKDDFDEGCDIFFVTDCCQSGTVCNLNDADFGDRPICHLAAVKDSQYAIDWGQGGGLTTCLVETIEDFMEQEDAGESKLSMVQVINHSYQKFAAACEAFGDDAGEQTFCFERTPDLDPDSLQFPLMPPRGWKINTMIDGVVD